MNSGFSEEIISDISKEKRDELVELAERCLGYDSLYVWNVNINGIVIQLRTNNESLIDFWQENWFPATLNHSIKPHATIYAVTGIERTEPKIYYHKESKTGIIFNIDFYERLRTLALGILMDISMEKGELNFLRGALVDVNGEGIVILGCTGTGKLTHAYLLLELERARIHSNDLMYIEHIGGEKGRLSTHISERKFYLHKNATKINPRINELFKKCKKEGDYFILDPWWIGGDKKFLDTTRIKVIFILSPKKENENIIKRLSEEEALNLLTNSKEPFCNPFLININKKQINLQKEFFKTLLNFAACYELNTAKPLFEVQKKMREIILSKEYIKPIIKPELELKVEKEEIKVDLNSILKVVKNLSNQSNVMHLKPEEVKRMAEKYGVKTKFGNYNFVSSVKNRSADLTVYIGSEKVMQENLNPKQKEILRNLPETLKKVFEYLNKAPFVCIKRTMGDNDKFTPKCIMYVSIHRKEMIRLAHMVNQTLFDEKDSDVVEYLVYIPEWHEKDRQILVFPEIGVTFVLGTDYYGEAKKGFLRMAMFFAKQRGMLGLHAGAKLIKAKDYKTGKIKKYSMLLFGLSGTGKTTHSCHDHGLNLEGEGIEIVQDDVVFLCEDCSILGTERGFYLKTEGLDPEIQPLIYNAVTKPNAIFENVMVDYLGNVYFGDDTLTGNGRGIMQRDDFGKYKSESINLPPVSELDGLIIIFITRRNTVVPIISKLTLEQAAAFFMLGESIETSASNPERAGESVREVGTNPFIVGDKAEEGNRFYEIISKYPEKVQCYLLNTGGVGEIMEKDENGRKIIKQRVLRIQIPETAAIIRGIVRGSIEWVKDEWFNVLIPKKVEGVDISKFNLSNFYKREQIENLVNELKKERIEYFKNFKSLNPKIVNSLQ